MSPSLLSTLWEQLWWLGGQDRLEKFLATLGSRGGTVRKEPFIICAGEGQAQPPVPLGLAAGMGSLQGSVWAAAGDTSRGWELPQHIPGKLISHRIWVAAGPQPYHSCQDNPSPTSAPSSRHAQPGEVPVWMSCVLGRTAKHCSPPDTHLLPHAGLGALLQVGWPGWSCLHDFAPGPLQVLLQSGITGPGQDICRDGTCAEAQLSPAHLPTA